MDSSCVALALAKATPAKTFDEASHMTLDRLKSKVGGLKINGRTVKFDALVDWAFAIADGQLVSSLRHLALESDISIALTDQKFEVAKELTEAMAVFDNGLNNTSAAAPAMSWQQLLKIGHDSEQDADLRKMFKKQEREASRGRQSNSP
jgi:hypothetical protein